MCRRVGVPRPEIRKRRKVGCGEGWDREDEWGDNSPEVRIGRKRVERGRRCYRMRG